MKPRLLYFGRRIQSTLNIKYLMEMFVHMGEDFEIDCKALEHYESIDPGKYDVMLYNTFPDPMNKKYNTPLTQATDRVFLQFPRYKVLVDSHDAGEVDGFSRFQGMNFPRIKHTPLLTVCHYFPITSNSTDIRYLWHPDMNTKRPITVFCGLADDGRYRHNIREWVKSTLINGFRNVCDFERRPFAEFLAMLPHVDIFVNAPGFGESTDGVYMAMQAGALVLSHSRMGTVRMFPYADLKSGENVVFFDTPEELAGMLELLLIDKGLRDRIRRNARETFDIGYDPYRSAKDLTKQIKERM